MKIFLDKYTKLLIFYFAVSFVIFCILRIGSLQAGNDFGIDVYYHIKASDMFPFIATTKVFPWTEMSIWKTNFCDKELGFHFLIFLIRKIQSFLGISKTAPFNFLGIFFTFIILISFAVWSFIKCRKTAFLAVPLLMFLSPEFFQKLITLRPFLISILLFSLIIFLHLSQLNFKKKIILFFIIGWLYTISYSVAIIALFPPTIKFLVTLFRDKETIKHDFFYLISVFIGILAGLTIHPQFPNTYIISYIQTVQVLLTTLGITPNQVIMATELNAPHLYDFITAIPVFVVFLINLLLFVKISNRNSNVFFVFILNLILLIGFFFSKRIIEYLVPVETVCFLLLCTKYKNSSTKTFTGKYFINTKSLVIFLILLIVIMTPVNRFQINRLLKLPVPCYKFSKWAKNHLKNGTYIGLLNWGDFPRLFYVSSEFKYSMALDPMFSYYVYPKRTELISRFMIGKEQNISSADLANAFGTNLIYIPNYYAAAAYYLLNRDSKIIYKDLQGCLVELTSNKD